MARPARGSVVYGRLQAFLPLGDAVGERPGAGHDYELHVDADAICPRCLTWIEAKDFVRRTSFGLAQHEVCPVDVPGARPRSDVEAEGA